jgi:poly(A) polymerase
MPIITPAYPSMCATHNVTQSTMEVMQREIKRGGVIADQIMLNKRPWKDLFAKHTFFTTGYKYYLSIISASRTKEAQQVWCGRVESKVRQLVTKLDLHNSIAVAHPFNKTFDRVHKCRNEEEVNKVKGGSLAYQFKDIPTEITSLKNDPEDGIAVVKDEDSKEAETKNGDDSSLFIYTTTSYIGLELYEGE